MTITSRIDNITRIPDTHLTETPPPPHSVKIELTARCDFQCFFCATAKSLRTKKDMDQAFYERVVREMAEAGVKELGVFYLGESFLCPWLADAIRFAKHEAGIPYVFLTTNGRMAKANRVRAIMEAGLDSLKWSFNNANAEEFHKTTRVRPADFERIIRNMQDAKAVRDDVERRTGHRCGLYASSILYTGEQRPHMADAIGRILPYVDEHYWLPLYSQASLMADGMSGQDVTAGNQGRIGALRQPIPCWSILTEGHVTYDGHLAACCFDHDGRFNMGNLNDMSFMDAWNSMPFRDLRRAHLEKSLVGTPCENCVAFS